MSLLRSLLAAATVAVLMGFLVYLRRSRAPARRRVLETARIHAVLGAGYLVLGLVLGKHAAGDALQVGFSALGLAFLGHSLGTVEWRAKRMELALGLDGLAMAVLAMLGAWLLLGPGVARHSLTSTCWAIAFAGAVHLEAIRRSGLELPAHPITAGDPDPAPARRMSEDLSLTGAGLAIGPFALAASFPALGGWPGSWADHALVILGIGRPWGRPDQTMIAILLGSFGSLAAAILFAVLSRTTSSRDAAILLAIADLASVALLVADPLESGTRPSDPFPFASAAISIVLLLVGAIAALLSMSERR